MRILLVNVNTTEAMTAAMAQAARRVAAEGTEVLELTPRFGAPGVDSAFESLLSAVAVMDAVVCDERDVDAVVLGGFGEHGREGLQELLDVPVLDIAECAAHVAMMLGRTFSVVTTLDRSVPAITDRLLLAGLHTRCASVRSTGLSTLGLEADPAATAGAVLAAAQDAVREDRAEVIVLGCGGLVGLESSISAELGVPVIDGIAAAVTLAESLVRMRLSTSKVRTYAPPATQPLVGWPLSRHLAW